MTASWPAKSTKRRAGVSLVELMIVLLVLGIVAAVVIPRWAGQLESYRAAAAAHRLLGDLERVRSLAYATSSSKTIVFDPQQDRYRIEGITDPDRPSEVYTVRLNDSPYQSAIVSVDFDGEVQLTFDGFGVPASGGTIVIQSGKTLRSIEIEGSTGKATIQ